MPQPTSRPKERSLLSPSSILIISGFLIGLTVGKIVSEDLSPYVLACGLSGFLAFITLDLSAARRQEEALALEKQQMEHRLDRHCHNAPAAGFVLLQPHVTTGAGRDAKHPTAVS